jgi:hypothetical protein
VDMFLGDLLGWFPTLKSAEIHQFKEYSTPSNW